MAKKKDEQATPQTYSCKVPIQHDGTAYGPGDPIELTQEAAAQLLSVGAIEESKA